MPEPTSGAARVASAHGPRTAGLEVARALALLGLMAADAFHVVPGTDSSALGPMSAGDCFAVTFAVVAGTSLALATGGRRLLECRHCASVRADLAVQAVLIAMIGFALGFAHNVPVVLSYYGVLCLLTMVLLGRPPWLLASFAGWVLLVAPIFVTWTSGHTDARLDGSPSFPMLVTDPSRLLGNLFLTGYYPVLLYLAYACAGLAIGRMDLSSVRLTCKLLAGGAATIAVSWMMWWLAGQASRSRAWVETVRGITGLGFAVVVVMAALLLVRTPLLERPLRSFRDAGTMALTLYSAHVLILGTGVLGISPDEQCAVLLIGALLFAVLWRRILADGPLEWLIAQCSCRARHALMASRGEPQ
ncbi:DUF418 domain-containing protein [Pseudonocardia sp. CA-142604]|uniref:DUF418 domain-containing protein n=1 Tax=Pseudonocardia sp. CA-142604 TaxID=3240024 RepID=UPI003D8B39A8